MEIVSERVSIDRADGRLSVVISARLPKSNEALLVAWFIAWLASGVYVAISRAGLPEPDWDLPTREWLGRALMKDGQFSEAERSFREEIGRNPRSGRALFGLAEALARQGKDSSAALVRREFEAAWVKSDYKLDAAALFK